jgi:hydroxymethylbilane synthase
VAALAREHAGELHLVGRVGDAASGRLVEADGRAPAADFEALGETVAQRLLAAGAGALLAAHAG